MLKKGRPVKIESKSCPAAATAAAIDTKKKMTLASLAKQPSLAFLARGLVRYSAPPPPTPPPLLVVVLLWNISSYCSAVYPRFSCRSCPSKVH